MMKHENHSANVLPVQVWHDSFADVTARLLQNPDDFSWGSGVPSRVDDDGAAELGLSMSCGFQHLLLTLCDGPAGANLSNHATADIRPIGAVEHFTDDDVRELTGRKRAVTYWQYSLKWHISGCLRNNCEVQTWSLFSSPSGSHLLHARPPGVLRVGAVHIVSSSGDDVDPSVLGKLPESGKVPLDARGGVLHNGSPTGFPVGQKFLSHGSCLLQQQQVLVAAVRVLPQPVHVLHLERVLCHGFIARRRRVVAAFKAHGQVLVGQGFTELPRIHWTQDRLDFAT